MSLQSTRVKLENHLAHIEKLLNLGAEDGVQGRGNYFALLNAKSTALLALIELQKEK